MRKSRKRTRMRRGWRRWQMTRLGDIRRGHSEGIEEKVENEEEEENEEY